MANKNKQKRKKGRKPPLAPARRAAILEPQTVVSDWEIDRRNEDKVKRNWKPISDPWWYKRSWRETQRGITKDLLTHLKSLYWQPRRCYMAYDEEADRVCIVFPESITRNVLYHYLELPMFQAGAPKVWDHEITELVKQANKNGRKNRRIRS